MKRHLWLMVALMMVLVMALGAGTACAATKDPATGRYVFTDTETAYPKFVGNQNQADAAYGAYMADLKVKTAVATKATAAAYARQDKWMTPFKVVTCPLPAIGYGILALRTPTNSLLEYLIFPSICRGANTAKNYMIQTVGGGAVDMATVLDESNKTTYAPVMGEMGVLADRTMKRGPIANTLEAAAYATPISCFAAGVLGPIAATSLPWTMAIVSTTVPVGATVVGEAAGPAEKKLIK